MFESEQSVFDPEHRLLPLIRPGSPGGLSSPQQGRTARKAGELCGTGGSCCGLESPRSGGGARIRPAAFGTLNEDPQRRIFKSCNPSGAVKKLILRKISFYFPKKFVW